jgi:CubicO group peptidase (beta-lactamase class C family)
MEVGSISKVMTGLVIADAERRGELDMGAPVSTYLPELGGSPAGGVMMRELVTHAAGYANFGPSVLKSAAWRAPLGLNFLGQSRATMMSDARGGTLGARGHFAYSSLGAAAAGQALMRVTGMSYSQLMESRLFAPLGMTHTFVQTKPEVPAGKSPSGLPVHPWVLGAYAPAGAVVSTTHDLALLATALLKQDAPGMDAMQPIAATDQANTEVGYFWRVSRWQTGQTITWHAGETGGYDSYLGLDRASGRAVIVLSDVAVEQTTNLGINLLARTR